MSTILFEKDGVKVCKASPETSAEGEFFAVYNDSRVGLHFLGSKVGFFTYWIPVAVVRVVLDAIEKGVFEEVING